MSTLHSLDYNLTGCRKENDQFSLIKMNIQTKTLNKYIIISSEILTYMSPLSVTTDYLSGDIHSIIADLDDRLDKDHPCGLIIFLHISEYAETRKRLSQLERNDIYYGFSLYIPPDKADTFSLDEHDIHYIWSGLLKKLNFDFAINKTYQTLEQQYRFENSADQYMNRLVNMKQDQESLINIGRSLSIEKNAEKLLRLILSMSKMITGADAGSIYLIEELPDGAKQIRFKYSHTFSKEIPLEEFVIPYDTKSIAGYVAVTGNALNIPDSYKLEKDAPVRFNNSFDLQNNYRSKSMLVIPMKSHTGEIIGVIQLINSKKSDLLQNGNKNVAFEIHLKTLEDFEEKVFPFAERYTSLMESVAGQAAIAIENSRLFNQIQTQFEEFVKASVSAIESRDPATSGHSFRIAAICVQMAEAINRNETPYWKEINFSPTQLKELEYAALLHDFGKVYIENAIFMKEKKLFPKEYENLQLKLDYLYRTIELQYRVKQNQSLASIEKIPLAEFKDIPLGKFKDMHLDQFKDMHLEEFRELEGEMSAVLEKIQSYKESLSKLNEPKPLDEDPSHLVSEIRKGISALDCIDISGKSMQILTDEEITNLSIKRGSLNEEERREIESHVVHTYNFVKQIPWPREFKNIPQIAYMHHEKLDGTGYPEHRKGDEIPMQARMMAIADIYDALTASDRPYKKSLSHERAIEILRCEADENKVDKELLEIFIEADICIDKLATKA